MQRTGLCLVTKEGKRMGLSTLQGFHRRKILTLLDSSGNNLIVAKRIGDTCIALENQSAVNDTKSINSRRNVTPSTKKVDKKSTRSA